MSSAAARRFTSALLALGIAIAACVSDEGGSSAFPDSPVGLPTRSDSLVIALVATLSGPGAWRGEDAFEGADLAVHELNKGRGRGEMPFEVVALDDRGSAEEATRRLTEVAQLEKVVGAIYAGPPDGLVPAEESLASAGIPAILVHGDLYGARALTAHLFQASPSFLWGARRLADYFLEDRRYRTIGMLAEDTPQGDTAVAAVRAALEDRNRRAHVVRYGNGLPPIEERLERLRDRGAEAVVVQGDAASFSSVLEALDDMGSTYRSTAAARIASARPKLRRRRIRRGLWRPQIAGFDQAISTAHTTTPPPGTIGVDSYARGVHFLPVPNFQKFGDLFREWWDSAPLGWEQRSYDAAHVIGRAARRSDPGEDIAAALEDLAEVRFGGSDIVLGPDDHTLIDQGAVGLWTIPRPDLSIGRSGRRPDRLQWVPLARGFSIDGRRTDIPAADWRHLFRRPPPPTAPPPPARRMKFSVSSPRSDPVH